MRMPLKISFGRSTSMHYARAVRLAESIVGYKRDGDGNDIVHRVAVAVPLADESTWDRLNRLMQLVSGWRSTQITVGGQPMSYWAMSARVAQIKACYAKKVQHEAGDDYCSGKNGPATEATHFGCRFCKGVSRHVRQPGYAGASWIQFGTLAPGRDLFHVDKKGILRALETQARQQVCGFCPAFSWKRLRSDVAELPDRIELGTQSKFEVKFSEINPNKILGIKPKPASDDADVVHRSSLAIVRERNEPPPPRNIPGVRYADIAGQDAALEQIKNVVQLPLTHPEYFEALGVRPQGGVLLYGPPGNGKTLIAKAVATESQAHFEVINGPEILSKWVGQSEENLRRVFARARQFAPSVVLIDELDSLAPRRELMSQQHDVQVISQMLVLLDGLESRGRVVVLATTNRIAAIDPAVRRPGRFDYHVEIPPPDDAGRMAILRVHLRTLKTLPGVGLQDLVEETAGFSGAELAALCREAGLTAIKRGLAEGIPPDSLTVSSRDLCQALEALRLRRLGIEEVPADILRGAHARGACADQAAPDLRPPRDS
jgi:transitional endoplasmic reticulum ATPase